ncbi:MAG: glutamine--fructose-6-phosphate transaminase (isomerizing) [Firmicutes bacterium]|nr:glutamine--fructose-6-phosphate transaminase (isomerizing) [Bacillota bacterium]
MCGIVGYIGDKQATPILLENLKKLEYRGYDSSGLAVYDRDRIEVRKAEGRIARLEEMLKGDEPGGSAGIGHTRWATHGRPSDINAHPHADCSGEFVVVHNGIIENYLELKEWLESRGHTFKSETDTEVLPHLVEEFYRGGPGDSEGDDPVNDGELEAAVREAIGRAQGSFAIAVMSQREPDRIVVARKNSPLIVGLGDGENFLASDIPALLAWTNRVIVLDDGEMAVLTRDGVRVSTFDGEPVAKDVLDVKWGPGLIEKGGYEHFMLKEIHEEPRAIRDTLAGRINGRTGEVSLEDFELDDDYLRRLKKIAIVACGTAYHAGLVGKKVIERLARIPVEVELASEFRYSDPMVGPDVLTIVISQSGETADTLAGLREARARGSRVLAITNVVGSSVAREADDVIHTWAGPEIAVASTKAYVAQLVSLYLFGIYLGRRAGALKPEDSKRLVEEIRQLPQHVDMLFGRHEERVRDFAREFARCEDVFFIGRGLDYAVSMEGSLKLKEVSYIRAEAYAAGELKHGTLALIVQGVPVFALTTQLDVYEKMLSNIKEVKARDATVIALAFEGDETIGKLVDYVIHIPKVDPLLTPVLSVVPLQLFAYYAAVARGCDVDKPRNLAKSVTVE